MITRGRAKTRDQAGFNYPGIAGIEIELSELLGKKVDVVRIADKVISRLAGLIDAEVIVTLDIEAYLPEGAPDHLVRAVTEDAQTLSASCRQKRAISRTGGADSGIRPVPCRAS